MYSEWLSIWTTTEFQKAENSHVHNNIEEVAGTKSTNMKQREVRTLPTCENFGKLKCADLPLFHDDYRISTWLGLY